MLSGPFLSAVITLRQCPITSEDCQEFCDFKDTVLNNNKKNTQVTGSCLVSKHLTKIFIQRAETVQLSSTGGASYRRLNITEFANIAKRNLRNITIFRSNHSSAHIAERANIAEFAWAFEVFITN